MVLLDLVGSTAWLINKYYLCFFTFFRMIVCHSSTVYDDGRIIIVQVYDFISKDIMIVSSKVLLIPQNHENLNF